MGEQGGDVFEDVNREACRLVGVVIVSSWATVGQRGGSSQQYVIGKFAVAQKKPALPANEA